MMTEHEWNALEDALCQLTAVEIATFALSHTDDTFYGFAFSCEGEYGDLRLSLNSEEHLHENLESVIKVPFSRLSMLNRRDRRRLRPGFEKLPPPTREELERELRWSPESWKYDGVESEAFKAAWAPFADAVLEARHLEPDWTSATSSTQRRFLISVCRVLVRLEQDHVFEALHGPAKFAGFVRDRWDTEEEAWQRLASVRSAMT